MGLEYAQCWYYSVHVWVVEQLFSGKVLAERIVSLLEGVALRRLAEEGRELLKVIRNRRTHVSVCGMQGQE